MMFLHSHRTVFTFCSFFFLDFLGVVLAFWISILQIYRSVSVMILLPLRFRWLMVLVIYEEEYLKEKFCPFNYKAFAVIWKVGIPYTGLTTPVGWLSLLQTDRPKSVHRSVWWRLGVFAFLSVPVGFCHGLSQISSFFSFQTNSSKMYSMILIFLCFN